MRDCAKPLVCIKTFYGPTAYMRHSQTDDTSHTDTEPSSELTFLYQEFWLPGKHPIMYFLLRGLPQYTNVSCFPCYHHDVETDKAIKPYVWH